MDQFWICGEVVQKKNVCLEVSAYVCESEYVLGLLEVIFILLCGQ